MGLGCVGGKEKCELMATDDGRRIMTRRGARDRVGMMMRGEERRGEARSDFPQSCGKEKSSSSLLEGSGQFGNWATGFCLVHVSVKKNKMGAVILACGG